MAKFIFVFLLLVFATDLLSQEIEPIQLDRPDQTETPATVPAKYIQVENGFLFEKTNQTESLFTFPSSLWKYGVNDKFELRIITELISRKIANVTQTGLMPITVGFKTALLQEKGIVPKTSFIGHITTSNVGSKQFYTKYIAPAFRFVMQHTLSQKMSLSYNLGAEWDGENAAQTYLYTVTTGASFNDKLGGYVELYGFLPKDEKAEHSFDGGLTYLINNDLMIDLSGGFGVTPNAPKHYIALGLSYRFKAIK